MSQFVVESVERTRVVLKSPEHVQITVETTDGTWLDSICGVPIGEFAKGMPFWVTFKRVGEIALDGGREDV